MSELDRWFHRQAGREERLVLLEEGLLGDRLWSYFWYRLRYFFATYLVESAAHAVMVLLLFRALDWGNFLVVIVAHAVTMLVSGTWWGVLESMRAQVRDLHRSGNPHRIAALVGGWLTLAALLGAAFLALAVGWTVAQALSGTIDVAEAYAATLALRVALDLPTRCYHSGVYAMRRVYKPLSASLGPELLGLVVMLALFPAVGAWALVVSSLLVTTTLTALTLHYTRRVYHFLGFAPTREMGVGRIRRSLRGAGAEALAGGASHGVMALDSLVILALLHGAGTDSESLIMLFLAMPAIRAGADWARLLYFDLKRLELRLFTNLRRRFERHTWRLAWLLGLAFWAVAAGIATAFYSHGLGVMYLALLAFFLARSVLAREQIQAFAERSYGAVLGTGALCLAGLAAVGAIADTEPERLAGVAVATAVAAVALGRLTRVARARGEPGIALLTPEWLGRLGHVGEPVRVGSAQVTSAGGPDRIDARSREERNRWRLDQLAERVARRLGRVGAAAWVGPDRVVWYEPAGESPRITAGWLQGESGGLVADLAVLDCPDGEEALLATGTAGLLGRASPHLLTTIVPVDVPGARATFEHLIPGGIVYSPAEPVPAALKELPGSELRGILFDATAFARDLGGGGRGQSRFDVTALCAGGELRLIFVADPRASRRDRARWRRLVTDLDVRASVGGARRRRTPSVSLDLSDSALRARASGGGVARRAEPRAPEEPVERAR